MSLQEVKQLKTNDVVGFAGILSTTSRQGKFIKLIDSNIAEIDYGDHVEYNHIKNLFKITQE